MSDEETDLTDGPLGDGGIHPGRYNMRMVGMALRKGWKIDEEALKQLPEQMLETALKAKSVRTRIAAAKVVILMHGQNIKLMELALKVDQHLNPTPKQHQHAHLHVHTEATQQQAELAALAADIRAESVVEAVPEGRPAIDPGTNGEAVDSSTAWSDWS